MIPHIVGEQLFPAIALSAAMGIPVAEQDVLGDAVVTHAPLDPAVAEDGPQEWMFTDWEEYLQAPRDLHPHADGPTGMEPEIFHMAVRLHPSDRALHRPEWAEIAQRLTHVAGLAPTGDEHACRWVALQARPDRLDVIANRIRGDGAWAQQPHPLARTLSEECRRIETDLGLVPAQSHGGRPSTAHRLARPPALPWMAADQSPSAVAAQVATLMHQLADEANGPIASVRGLIEQAAHRLDELPHAYGPHAAHELEWIAGRLYGIQQDLDATTADLPGASQRAAARSVTPPAPHSASARRSR
ncbi:MULTISPECIES: hypothetical protein [unclassified Streptomyces]|uniref:hypothetical protein n=1 Tax=unclassified Streptomyces TaxID=2593676 RepID=UPI00340EF31E